MPEVVLCGGKRTPFGDFGRSLKDIPLMDLGVHAAKATLAELRLSPEKVDHLVWANTLPVDGASLFGSRVVALKIGMAEESCALNVSRACGSGTQAIVSAVDQIRTGQSRLALAGGGESYSRAAYVAEGVRYGAKRGPAVLTDTLDWCYRDPFDGQFMGETAENLAEDFQYSRDAMDEWGFMSQKRAGHGIASGFLAKQIAPIEVPEGKGKRAFAVDEFPRPDVTREKLKTLKPAFKPGGRVTAGNSSGITDGAAFVVAADRATAEKEGLAPRARFIDYAVIGVPPRIMGVGPVPAIAKLLERNDLKVSDIDYFEINEAFAAVNLHAEKQLGIPRDATNLYGGGISIGHPPGATGVRMTLVALQHLENIKGRYGVISMCLGAGQGMAMLIENLRR
ncbi:MAG: thiolase family protein [Alphaproteobacteria bacterium]|nr:thiolase family protein [Alphaproteobacteria bacterium]